MTWHDVALAGLATLLPLVLYRNILLTEAAIESLDAIQLQYPRYRILRDALLDGRFPAAWQSLLYAGGPFHANPENPTLYPPALLAAAVGPASGPPRPRTRRLA